MLNNTKNIKMVTNNKERGEKKCVKRDNVDQLMEMSQPAVLGLLVSVG